MVTFRINLHGSYFSLKDFTNTINTTSTVSMVIDVIVVLRIIIISTCTSLRELSSLFVLDVLVVNEKYFTPFVVIILIISGHFVVVKTKGNKFLEVY
jgi:hypothetical protein